MVEKYREPDVPAEDPQGAEHKAYHERIERPEYEIPAKREVAQCEEDGRRRQAETRLHRSPKEQFLAERARRRQQRRISCSDSSHGVPEAAEERSRRGKETVRIEIEEDVEPERRAEQNRFRRQIRPVRV